MSDAPPIRFIPPLRADRGAVAAGCLGGVGLVAFAALTVAVSAGWQPGFDTALLWVFRRVGEPGRLAGPDALLPLTRGLTALGGLTWLSWLTVGGFALLVVSRPHRGLAVLLLVVIASAFGVEEAIKAIVDRPRPHVVPWLASVSTASFPSGHAVLGATFYLTGAIILVRLAGATRWGCVTLFAAAGAIIGLIGLSRVLLGVHYATDVLAGWALGLFWAMSGWLVGRGVAAWRGRVRT